MSEDCKENDSEQPEYYYYLDFQGSGSLWGTGRHLMRVVEGGVYRREKRTTSNTITETVRVTELDPESGEVTYTIRESHRSSRTGSGVAEGMGQIRAKRDTPTAHLGTEDIPEGVSPHNRTRGWPSRPMDPEDIPEDSEPEVMTDGGSDIPEDGEPRSGAWLGIARGMAVREPVEDADHPVLEIRGDEGIAAVEMPPETTEGLTHAAAELDMTREEMVTEPWPIAITIEVTDGDVNAVTVSAMSEYLTAHPSGDLCDFAKGKAVRKTEDGEVSLLAYEDGAVEVTNVTEFGMTDDGSGQDPDVMTDGGVDGPAELMNLARHYHDKSREYRYRAGNHTSEDSELMMNQIADAYANAADNLRNLARYLDGEGERRPPFLSHGEELSGDKSPVPWRSGGEDGGDGDE